MHDSSAQTETERPTAPETLPPPGPQQHAVSLPPPGPHHHPVAPPVAYPAHYTPGAPPAARPSSRPGLVLGVISLIASGLALLGVIGLFIWTAAGPNVGQPFPGLPSGMPTDGFGPPPAPLTGQLSSVPSGRLVSSEALTEDITQQLEDDGWTIQQLQCPQVGGLAQGTVAVCHGTMDESDWAVIVIFEDSRGTYTLSLV